MRPDTSPCTPSISPPSYSPVHSPRPISPTNSTSSSVEFIEEVYIPPSRPRHYYHYDPYEPLEILITQFPRRTDPLPSGSYTIGPDDFDLVEIGQIIETQDSDSIIPVFLSNCPLRYDVPAWFFYNVFSPSTVKRVTKLKSFCSAFPHTHTHTHTFIHSIYTYGVYGEKKKNIYIYTYIQGVPKKSGHLNISGNISFTENCFRQKLYGLKILLFSCLLYVGVTWHAVRTQPHSTILILCDCYQIFKVFNSFNMYNFIFLHCCYYEDFNCRDFW